MWKVKSNTTVKLLKGISKFMVLDHLNPAPYLFTLNKDSGVKIRPALNKSCLFHELEDMKS